MIVLYPSIDFQGRVPPKNVLFSVDLQEGSITLATELVFHHAHIDRIQWE